LPPLLIRRRADAADMSLFRFLLLPLIAAITLITPLHFDCFQLLSALAFSLPAFFASCAERCFRRHSMIIFTPFLIFSPFRHYFAIARRFRRRCCMPLPMLLPLLSLFCFRRHWYYRLIMDISLMFTPFSRSWLITLIALPLSAPLLPMADYASAITPLISAMFSLFATRLLFGVIFHFSFADADFAAAERRHGWPLPASFRAHASARCQHGADVFAIDYWRLLFHACRPLSLADYYWCRRYFAIISLPLCHLIFLFIFAAYASPLFANISPPLLPMTLFLHIDYAIRHWLRLRAADSFSFHCFSPPDIFGLRHCRHATPPFYASFAIIALILRILPIIDISLIRFRLLISLYAIAFAFIRHASHYFGRLMRVDFFRQIIFRWLRHHRYATMFTPPYAFDGAHAAADADASLFLAFAASRRRHYAICASADADFAFSCHFPPPFSLLILRCQPLFSPHIGFISCLLARRRRRMPLIFSVSRGLRCWALLIIFLRL